MNSFAHLISSLRSSLAYLLNVWKLLGGSHDYYVHVDALDGSHSAGLAPQQVEEDLLRLEDPRVVGVAAAEALNDYAGVGVVRPEVLHSDVPLRLVGEQDGDLLAALREDLAEVSGQAEVRLGHVVSGHVIHLQDLIGKRREFDLWRAGERRVRVGC